MSDKTRGKRRPRYYRRRAQAAWIAGIVMGVAIVVSAVLMAASGDESGINTSPASGSREHVRPLTPDH